MAASEVVFVVFALFVSVPVKSIVDEELNRFLGDKEGFLRALEQDVLVGYQRQCGTQCSFHRNIYACSSPELEEESVCSQEYGASIFTGTGCATCTNRKLSVSGSYIRTPSREATCTDALNRDICLSQGLDTSFLDNWSKDERKPGVKWQFFASQTGMYRMFPGVAQERCHDYDPRLRAWYVSATTGPKDVVIVIDSSDSMALRPWSSPLTLMEITKEAVNSVLWTLTHLDYVAVVSFATLAHQLTIQNKNTLVQATHDNIQALTQEVKKVEPNGHTNFEAAFRTAFDILQRSEVVSRTAGCNKMVLFMTDGEPTRGEREPEQLTQIIRSLNQREDGSKVASIFTYSVGGLADTTITKVIACKLTTQFPHVSYTEEDLAGSVISERYKALSMMDKVEDVIDTVMGRHRLIIGQEMKEAILQYIRPCLREKCFLANHQYRQEPHRHLVFGGPAGTGKTSVAKAFAEILYELGLSESKDVVVIRRDTISSEFTNMMERRMRDAMKEATGKIILVDEIYQLGCGREATKALEVIMNRALEPKTSSSIIILAGYLQQIEQKIFSLNEGFRGRFPDTVQFLPLTVQQLTDILEQKIRLSGHTITDYCREEMETAIGSIPIEVRSKHNARLVNQVIVKANTGQDETTLTRPSTLLTQLQIPFNNLVLSCKNMSDKPMGSGLGNLQNCPTCGQSLHDREEQEEGSFDYNEGQGSSQGPDIDDKPRYRVRREDVQQA